MVYVESIEQLITIGKSKEECLHLRTDEFKLKDCQTATWCRVWYSPEHKAIHIDGDSESKLIRGCIQVIRSLYNGASPQWIIQNGIFPFTESNLYYVLSAGRLANLELIIRKLICCAATVKVLTNG